MDNDEMAEKIFSELEDILVRNAGYYEVQIPDFEKLKAAYVQPDPMMDLYLYGEATNPRVIRGEE